MSSSNPSSNPTVSDLQRAVKDTVRSYWQLFLTQGVIMTGHTRYSRCSVHDERGGFPDGSES